MQGMCKLLSSAMLSNPNSHGGCTTRPDRQKCRPLEQRKIYSKGHLRGMGDSCLKDLNVHHGFIGKMWGEGCSVGHGFLNLGEQHLVAFRGSSKSKSFL